MTQRFTIAGSTLSLLKRGEQGTVARITSSDEVVVSRLKSMGVVPGSLITLEQRSPHYLIRVGYHRFALSQSTAKAIYLRLPIASVPNSSWKQLNQLVMMLFKRLKITTKASSYPQSIVSSVTTR